MHSKTSNLIFLNKISLRTWILLGIACILLFAPFIVITLVCLYIYRHLVDIALKIQIKEKYVGLLKSTDYIWVIEDPASQSIITSLAILEKARKCSNTIFLEEFRNLINDRIVSKAAGTTFEKLFYRRKQKFGYYFWERSDKINLKNHIKWLECKNDDCDGSCEDASSETFRRNLGSICNKPLPDNNTALWEILIGRRCPRSTSHGEKSRLSPKECFNIGTHRIPIVVRIHHSLCDGVAIVKVFLKAIADENEVKVSKETKIGNTSTDENAKNFEEFVTPLCNSVNNIQDETDVVLSYKKNILTVLIYSIYITQSQILKYLQDHFHVLLKFFKNATIDPMKQLYEKIKEGARSLIIPFVAPGFLIHQIIRSINENALHGSPQTGEKVVTYWLETDANVSPKLLMKIREIRKYTSARFEDVILAAISASVHKYYLHINKPIPDALTALFPVKITTSENFTFDNEFSLALLRVGISNVNEHTITEANRDSQFFKRLEDIIKANSELRKSQDIFINFWMMKYFAALLPVKMIKPLLSSFNTIVFSNMLGPEKVRIRNNSLSNIIFWTPTKCAFAVGFALLSYGGNVHLSLIADKSVIMDEKLFMNILEDTVHELDSAYNSIKCIQKHPRKEISTCFKKNV